MILLGMAGGTASGKSTLARLFHQRLSDRCALIDHDRYYLDVPEPRGHNYDHPDALDTSLLVENLKQLRSGQSTLLPRYDFRHHRRMTEGERLDPKPVVLVEGILVLADPRLRELMDLRVFVHADADLRLARRIRRDMQTRGRSADSVLEQYLKTVRPMHQSFVEPSRAAADLILSGEGDLEDSLARLSEALRALESQRPLT